MKKQITALPLVLCSLAAAWSASAGVPTATATAPAPVAPKVAATGSSAAALPPANTAPTEDAPPTRAPLPPAAVAKLPPPPPAATTASQVYGCLPAMYDRLPWQAFDFALGGALWFLGTDLTPGGHGVYKMNAAGSFDKIDGGAMKIAVTQSGTVWVVNDNRNVFYRSNNSWHLVPDKLARGITAGGDSVYISATDGVVYKWNSGTWTSVSPTRAEVTANTYLQQPPRALAAGPDGRLLYATLADYSNADTEFTAGDIGIYFTDKYGWVLANPALGSDPSRYTWFDRLSVGLDGTVWGSLSVSNKIAYRSAEANAYGNWTFHSCSGRRVTTDANHYMYVLDRDGNMFRSKQPITTWKANHVAF